MLADYLRDEHWHKVADGVQMYKIQAGKVQAGTYRYDRKPETSDRLEFFFCCGGFIRITRKRHSEIHIREKEILILSDDADINTIEIKGALIGYCIFTDTISSRYVFENIYREFGHMDICDGRVMEMMRHHGGCMRIHNTSWNQAAFAVLRSLPFAEQGYYCMMKIVELIYLLCAHHALLDSIADEGPALEYGAAAFDNLKSYMESHLEEKLTIEELSRRFHMSPTALKNGFSAIYGQPVHSWIQERRIQQAAEMLRFSDLTVLQIAQTVGYEGVSQFNVLFKRHYGITPSRYRKMSDSVSN